MDSRDWPHCCAVRSMGICLFGWVARGRGRGKRTSLINYELKTMFIIMMTTFQRAFLSELGNYQLLAELSSAIIMLLVGVLIGLNGHIIFRRLEEVCIQKSVKEIYKK